MNVLLTSDTTLLVITPPNSSLIFTFCKKEPKHFAYFSATQNAATAVSQGMSPNYSKSPPKTKQVGKFKLLLLNRKLIYKK